MNPVYNAGIALYSVAARLAARRSPKVRRMLAGQADTFERLRAFRESLAPEGFDLWIHAASLGEFEQGRPLIDALLRLNPAMTILLSFFSPSGYEVRRDYHPRVATVYLPFDTPANAARFIDEAAPRMAIFVKYEFWGNYLSQLKRRHIPTYIISAIFRPGQIFFRPWGGMFRTMLGAFSRLYVQNDESRRLLADIGVDNVTVAGDTRFDRVTDIRAKRRSIDAVEVFKNAVPEAFTLVVGSSWERDEDIYIPLINEDKNLRAIIAPHEFDAERLSELQRRLGADRAMLYSEFEALCRRAPAQAAERAAGLKYLIIDCFGLLSSLYAYADAAYVGGGFGTGIHNINEAAVYGIPVLFGPKHGKFAEASDLLACGGAFEIKNKSDLADTLGRLTTDRQACASAGHAAEAYIASKLGATALIAKDIFNIDIQ